MKTVNALTIRNHLGEVLDTLNETKEPILISRGRKISAALITIEDYKTRFIDKQAEEERKKLFKRILSLQARGVSGKNSIEALRELRGYGK